MPTIQSFILKLFESYHYINDQKKGPLPTSCRRFLGLHYHVLSRKDIPILHN